MLLDNGITQILHILDDKDGWEVKRIPKQLWMGRMRILWQMQRSAVNEKGVLTDNADGSAYTKAYEASGCIRSFL